MKYALLAALWLLSQLALAENSLYDKIVSLRFATEESLVLDQGTADIQSISSSQLIHIKGFVPFIPNRFLEPAYLAPEKFAELLQTPDAALTKLRMKTNLYPFEGQSSHRGSFLIHVKSEGARRLALGVPRFFQPMQLYVIDRHQSQRIVVHGDLEQPDPDTAHRSTPSLVIRAFDVVDDFYLLAHVAEPADQDTSRLALSSLFLGDEGSLQRTLGRSAWVSAIISGVFLMIAIFYGFIYLLTPDKHSSLYVSCFAVCSLVFSLLHFTYPPLDNNEVVLVYKILNGLATVCLQLFVLNRAAPGLAPALVRTYHRSLLFLAVLTLLSGLMASRTLINTIIFINLLSSVVLLAFTSYYGIKNKLSWAGFLVAGALANMALQLPLFVRSLTQQQDELGYSILLANFVMCVALALINAKEFSETYQNAIESRRRLSERNREIEFLNQNLEKLVNDKTKEVRELLDFIPQGVLSIVDAGTMDKNYSAHLKGILGTDAIAGQSFLHSVLDRTDLSADAKDRIWQAIHAILGEADIAFEINRAQLPDLIAYRHPEGARILKTTWNALFHEERVRGILVTLLDVSSEVEAQQRTQEQNFNLLIIQELIALEAEKFRRFVQGNLPLLKECENLIRVHAHLSEAELRFLFVTVHTVKGAARTYGLKQLSSRLHDFEYRCQKLMNQLLPYKQLEVLSDIQACVQIFELYVTISAQTLNRSQSEARLTVDRSGLEQVYHMFNDSHVGVDAKWLREARRILASMLFDTIEGLVASWTEKAARIAKDLSKEEPRVNCKADDILLTQAQATIIDNCMIHILRNALDHGLETPAERMLKGKRPAGAISFVASLAGESVELTIQDDGRGLSLEGLRMKAQKRGILNGGESPARIADLIFMPEISTAHELSETSGRGIGMAAVRSFLAEVGGTIEVQLLSEKPQTPGYFDFCLKISLPRWEKSA